MTSPRMRSSKGILRMFVGTASWMLQENPRKKQSGREKPTLTAPGSNAIPPFSVAT